MSNWMLIQNDSWIDIVCPKCRYVRFKDYACNCSVDELKNKEVYKDFISRMKYCENCGEKMEANKE